MVLLQLGVVLVSMVLGQLGVLLVFMAHVATEGQADVCGVCYCLEPCG